MTIILRSVRCCDPYKRNDFISGLLLSRLHRRYFLAKQEHDKNFKVSDDVDWIDRKHHLLIFLFYVPGQQPDIWMY